MTQVTELSDRQLEAYNRGDVEAFCACYHPQVTVLDERGEVTREGMANFRESYARMFKECSEVRATITERVALGDHVVELESWSRRGSEGELQEGRVIVRYTECDGLVRWVQFLS